MNNDILEVFWSNVDYFREANDMNWTEIVGGNASLARKKKLNVTLKKVADIAEVLGIDDYAILFEELGE